MALRALADGALFAEAIGTGPPRILALHGWGRRGADFAPSLAGVPSLALDLPGFGASPQPPAVLGAHGYAELIAPVLDQFPHPPVVVGHSFGGRIAVCLAASRPGRVGPLVLTGAPLVRLRPPAAPSLAYRAVRALHRIGLVSDRRMETERRRRGSADYRAATGRMRDILVKVVNESYESELARIPGPVVLVWGEDDDEVPVEVAEAATRLISGAGGRVELEVLAGVGHHVPLQAPDALRRVIDRVLGS